MNNNTLTKHVHDYLVSRRATGTYNAKSVRGVRPRLNSLSDHFGRRRVEHLTPDAIERWLDAIEGTMCENSRSSYLSSVRAFTAWMTVRGRLAVDPCSTLAPLPRDAAVPRAMDAGDVRLALEACATERDRAIVWLMVSLGLRRMEVAGLRWEHYDRRSATLHVVTSKGRTDRYVPVTNEAARALAGLHHRGSTGPIITSHRTGQALTPERVGSIVSRAMSAAGVKVHAYDGVSAHALRHTAASDVLDTCGDLRTVQQMLGHAHLSTTAIYLRRKTAESIRDAMEGRDYSRRAA